MKKAKYLLPRVVMSIVAVLVSLIAFQTMVSAFVDVSSSAVTDADFIESPSYGSLIMGEDYAYSFAVVGDTQSLNYQDVTSGTKNMQKLYQWILDNQSEKNIQYVLGLGDITNAVYKTPAGDLYDVNYGEWQNAIDAINLLNNNIPYSLVRGNHDGIDEFNSSFGEGTYYYDNLVTMSASGNAGFYPSYINDSQTIFAIDNTWRKVEIGAHKYLIMTLGHGQNEGVYAWANDVIAANPDYKVIATTHQFIKSDGKMYTEDPTSGPYLDADSKRSTELWNNVLSKHANVMMMICGHVCVDDIVTTQMIGENGNIVTCMLVDAQDVDIVRDDFKGNVGMVAMFYFSEDGSSMKVEYISTIRDSDQDDTTHSYLKDKNQFSLDLSYECVETEHGFIPKYVYDNPTDYPFVLFQDGSYIGANSQWATNDGAGAWITARGRASAERPVTILQMRDYVIASGGDKNVTHLNGNIIVDLGDNTLTTGSRNLFDLDSKKTGRKGSIEIYGGNIVISKSLLVGIKAASYANQSYNITFRDIDISFEEGTGLNSLVADRLNIEATEVFESNISFINCDIDFTNAANGGLAFDIDQEAEYQKTNIRISGGTIIIPDFSSFKLATTNKGYDSVAFGKYDEVYTKFILPRETEMPTVSYSADNGKTLSFVDESDANNAIFTLIEYEYIDGYGIVPSTYADEQEYPFALYYYYQDEKNPDNNRYVFLNAYKWWANSSSADGGSNSSPLGVLYQGVKYYLNNSKELDLDGNKITNVTVVLRRDYVVKTGNYTNFSQINGSFTLDLNNYTITTGTSGLYKAVKKNNNFNTYVTTKNGTILMGKSAVVDFGSDNRNTYGSYIDLKFDNVKIGFAKDSTSTAGVVNSMVGTNYGDYCGKDSVEFNNCEFDLVTNAPSNAKTMFTIGNDADNHQSIITINGGLINAGSDFVLENIKDTHTISKDSIVFGKGSDGKHLSVVLPQGSTAPTGSFNDGSLVFVKVAANVDNVTYRLQPIVIAAINFIPKTSITLGSELVYNIYVPALDYLKSYTVDGNTYDNLVPVTLDDGNQYYHIAVPMAVSEAARNIILKATLTVEGKNYTGTFTMSIPTYAKKIIEANKSEKEVTLVKDVLAYIRAAYIHFDAEDKAEAAKAIDDIIGNYNSTFAKTDGVTNTENGLWGVVIVLDAKPFIRFVLPEGVTDNNYTFKSGSTTLKYTPGTMTIEDKTYYYAEVSLYAYQLIKEITYSDGTNSGSYHINSYYDFVTTNEELKNDTNLIALVEKLYNYCKSAEAYRASVTSK